MLKRAMAAGAAMAVVGGLLAPGADARVRVRHQAPHQTKVDLHIPDLPAIDYKGLTNADALTVSIAKTALLPAAAPGGKPLGNLVRGTHLKKLGEQGGYWQVETANHLKGFVIKYAVVMGLPNLSATRATVKDFVIITAPKVDVHAMASVKMPTIATLTAKTKVEHLFTMAGFYKVKTPQGKVGWIEQSAGTISAK